MYPNNHLSIKRVLDRELPIRSIIGLFTSMMVTVACGSGSAGGAGGSSGVGLTGSTARFAIAGDVLYTLSAKPRESEGSASSSSRNISSGAPIITTFDISQPTTPKKVTDVPTSTWPETLYSNGSQLFVGATTGMEIYDLIDPQNPKFQSLYPHIRACDPVVTDGNTAYVTLRGGGRCKATENVLEIIDIAKPTEPKKLTAFAMSSPFGLTVKDGRAFICDGPSGLRILDVKDHTQIKNLPGVPEDICTDVILNDQRLVTIGFTGLAQYDVSQSPPRKLSVIQTTGG